jgi:hypothetical protein
MNSVYIQHHSLSPFYQNRYMVFKISIKKIQQIIWPAFFEQYYTPSNGFSKSGMALSMLILHFDMSFKFLFFIVSNYLLPTKYHNGLCLTSATRCHLIALRKSWHTLYTYTHNTNASSPQSFVCSCEALGSWCRTHLFGHYHYFNIHPVLVALKDYKTSITCP